MAVCNLTSAYVLVLPPEAQRALARECKPTDFEVPETFLNRLQDLSSCFLKDIAGKEGRRRRVLDLLFFFVVVVLRYRGLNPGVFYLRATPPALFFYTLF